MPHFLDYWRKIVTASPRLAEHGNMTLTTTEFRRQVEKAYRAGRDDERQNAAEHDSAASTAKPTGGLHDFFGNIFGGADRNAP